MNPTHLHGCSTERPDRAVASHALPGTQATRQRHIALAPPARRWLITIAPLLMMCASPVQAVEYGMICERGGKSYKVSYDTVSRIFRTDNPQLGSRFRLNRVQLDKDAALVWVTALNFSAERDVLAQFGREKWVKYFFGNGSEITDRCR